MGQRIARAWKWFTGLRPVHWLANRPQGSWGSFASLVQVTVVILAAYYAYGQWRDDKLMDLQKNWSSPEMLERRARLRDAVTCRSSLPLSEARQAASAPRAQVDFSLRLIYPSEGTSTALPYPGLERDVAAFDDFFSDVHQCIQAHVCDEQTSCTLFGTHASRLNRRFEPYLMLQRAWLRDPGYATDINDVMRICAPYDRPVQQLDEIVVDGVGSDLANEPTLLAYLHNQQHDACARMATLAQPLQPANGPPSRGSQARVGTRQ